MAAASSSSSDPITSLSFSSLLITPRTELDADSCLVHLKLLACFGTLKQRIGKQDGLWEIYDSRALNASGSNTAAVLALLREKRWAIYLARAVDRYETWFKALGEQDMKGAGPRRIRENDMYNRKKEVEINQEAKEAYLGFVEGKGGMGWGEKGLPPLDVLMVWHAHMLNPRSYLQDCMRCGSKAVWNMGMPWSQLNASISDEDLSYRPCKEKLALGEWERLTSRPWANEDEPMLKKVQCPSCSFFYEVPWTTCGIGENTNLSFKPGMVGEGYGDGHFSVKCTCGATIDMEGLKVARFIEALKALVSEDLPLPGTLWAHDNGILKLTEENSQRLFPSRLAKKALLARVLELVKPGSNKPVAMTSVRDELEEVLLDSDLIKDIGGAEKKISAIFKMTLDAKIHIRRMMAPFWQTASSFSLDLIGAVVRQGEFVDKMNSIDWLHSPAARHTMERLLIKYGRFMQIIISNQDNLAVPTLDVDLAWHTHQLSPAAYYNYCIGQSSEMGKKMLYVDHNDKVDEDKLSDAFVWTCKEYQERYNEVYAECTCWYCEAVRWSLVSTVGKMFGGKGKQEKVIMNFYASEASARVDVKPPNAAHISAHPAVHADESPGRRRTSRRRRLLAEKEFNEGFMRASKNFSKRAKKGGSSEAILKRVAEERDHWGLKVEAPGPWAHPHYLRKDIYPSGAPVEIPSGPNKPGACVTGSCSGRTGCGNGMVGICGAGCTGSGIGVNGSSCGANTG